MPLFALVLLAFELLICLTTLTSATTTIRDGVFTLPNRTTGQAPTRDSVLRNVAIRQLPNDLGRKDCKDQPLLVLEIAAVYNNAFCGRFQNEKREADKFIEKAIKTANVIFAKQMCISLKIEFKESSCNGARKSSDPFALPTKSPCAAGRKCARTEEILDNLRSTWNSKRSKSDRYDVVLLFDGTNDDTGVAGAAYVESVCDSRFGFAWIEYLEMEESQFSAVLTHEIAHLMGAQHDNKGVMKRVLPNDPGPLQLSNKSITDIDTFVKKDSRSWCLSRTIGDDAKKFVKEAWSQVRSERSEGTVSDIAIGERPGEPGRDVYVLSVSPTVVKYRVLKNLAKDEDGNFFIKGGKNILSHEVKIRCDGCQYGPIALLKRRDGRRPDIIAAYTEFKAGKGNIGSYQVGRTVTKKGFEGKSYGRKKWEASIPVPDWNPAWTSRSLRPYKRYLFTIATGKISGGSAIDLVWMYLDSRIGRAFVRYRLGLDLNEKGVPLRGWGEDIRVPGWFGYAPLALRVAVGYVAGDERPDLVVFNHDSSRLASATYYRVGRDMNETGHVTGGWSAFIRIPMFDYQATDADELARFLPGISLSTFRVGADGKAGNATLVVPRMVKKKRRPEVLSLILSEQTLTELTFDKSVLYTEERFIDRLCYECYIGASAETCASQVQLCSTWLDEVRVEGSVLKSREVSLGRKPPSSKKLERSRDSEKSLQCKGFGEFYKDRDIDVVGSCGLIDNRKLAIKGIMLALKEELEGVVNLVVNDDVSFGGDAASTSGRSDDSVAGIVTVRAPNNKRWKQAVIIAIRKLRKRLDDYGQIFTENPKVKYKKKDKRFEVTMFFTQKYLDKKGPFQ